MISSSPSRSTSPAAACALTPSPIVGSTLVSTIGSGTGQLCAFDKLRERLLSHLAELVKHRVNPDFSGDEALLA
jgi:hypothetical protein